jgi:ankyrin repeat protein
MNYSKYDQGTINLVKDGNVKSLIDSKHSINHIINDLFQIACNYNRSDMILYIHSQGANINTKGTFSNVIYNKNFEIIKYFIRNDVNLIEASEDHVLLLLSVNNEDDIGLDIFKWIYKERPNDDFFKSIEPLLYRIESNIFYIVKWFHSIGCDLFFNNNILFLESIKYNHIDICNYMLENGGKIHPLSMKTAYEYCSSNSINYLESLGEIKPISISYRLILMLSNYYYDKIYFEKINILDEYSLDLLVIACKRGIFNIVKELVDLGINIHYLNEKSFRYACKYNHLDIVNYLLKYNPDVTIENNYAIKHTCICEKNDENIALEIIKILINKGANIHTNNNKCFRNACIYERFNIAKFLYLKDINSHINNDYAYRYSYGKIRKWIKSLNK